MSTNETKFRVSQRKHFTFSIFFTPEPSCFAYISVQRRNSVSLIKQYRFFCLYIRCKDAVTLTLMMVLLSFSIVTKLQQEVKYINLCLHIIALLQNEHIKIAILSLGKNHSEGLLLNCTFRAGVGAGVLPTFHEQARSSCVVNVISKSPGPSKQQPQNTLCSLRWCKTFNRQYLLQHSTKQ